VSIAENRNALIYKGRRLPSDFYSNFSGLLRPLTTSDATMKRHQAAGD
jgi:hypothetical protein